MQTERPFLKRSFFTVLLALLFTVSIGLLYYIQSQRLVAQNTNTNVRQNLEKKVLLFDQVLEDVVRFQKQLATYPDIVQFFNFRTTEPFTGTNTGRILDILKYMFNYSLLNPLVQEYFVFFNRPNVAMSAGAAFDLDRFFRGVLTSVAPPWSPAELRGAFMPTESTPFYIPELVIQYQAGRQEAVVSVFPVGRPALKGSVVVLLDTNRLEDLLGDKVAHPDAALIFLKDGVPLVRIGRDVPSPEIPGDNLSGHFETEIEGTRYMVFHHTIRTSDVTGISMVPIHFYNEQMTPLRRTNYFVVSMLLLLTVVFAIMLAAQNNRSLRNLLRFVESRTGASIERDDAVGYIKRSFSTLLVNKSDLEQKVDSYVSSLKQRFTQDLLSGRIVTDALALSRAQDLGVDLAGSGYAVLLLSKPASVLEHLSVGFVENEMLKARVKHTLQHDTNGVRGLVSDHQFGWVAVILVFASDQTADKNSRLLTETARRIAQSATSSAQRLSGGIGNIHAHSSEIPRSLDEAVVALGTATLDGIAEIVRYDRSMEADGVYNYSENQENRLIGAIISGEPESAEACIDSVVADNLEKRVLSRRLLSLLVSQIQGSLIRLTSRKQIAESLRRNLIHELGQIGPSRPFERNLAILKKQTRDLAAHFRDASSSHTAGVVRKVTEYIHEHYAEMSLGLDQVADSFSLSPVYLSHLFKEEKGEKFSTYVEATRIGESRSLLEQSQFSVKEIAGFVGYGSSGTFIRAFRRATGITPTVYRTKCG